MHIYLYLDKFINICIYMCTYMYICREREIEEKREYRDVTAQFGGHARHGLPPAPARAHHQKVAAQRVQGCMLQCLWCRVRGLGFRV